jgi:phage/plasmid-like protein (TIGR03299 family)
MAHDLNYNNGKHSFMSVNQKAWHGLGQIIDKYPTSAEAIKFAGLDYTVEKRPLFTYDTENNEGNPDANIIIPEIDVPNFFATVRKDTEQVLGVVGNDYTIVQNCDAFTFFDSIVGGDGIQYETAGALGKGERIFITAKLPGYIQVGREDLIEKYLFLTSSHDGSGSISAAFTPVRIVCANTLNAALRSTENCIRIRHTDNAQERLKQAHKIMGISNIMTNQLDELFNRWAKIQITDKEVLRLVQKAMAPSKEVLQNIADGNLDELSSRYKNTVDEVCSYAFSNPTQQMQTTKGTLFGAYNAITGYYNNVKSYKNEEAKLKNIMFGNASTKGQAAFNLCTTFAEKGIISLN